MNRETIRQLREKVEGLTTIGDWTLPNDLILRSEVLALLQDPPDTAQEPRYELDEHFGLRVSPDFVESCIQIWDNKKSETVALWMSTTKDKQVKNREHAAKIFALLNGEKE